MINYRSMSRDPHIEARPPLLHLQLLGAGVIVGSKGTGCRSTPMDRIEVDQFVEALREVVGQIL